MDFFFIEMLGFAAGATTLVSSVPQLIANLRNQDLALGQSLISQLPAIGWKRIVVYLRCLGRLDLHDHLCGPWLFDGKLPGASNLSHSAQGSRNSGQSAGIWHGCARDLAHTAERLQRPSTNTQIKKQPFVASWQTAALPAPQPFALILTNGCFREQRDSGRTSRLGGRNSDTPC